MRPTTGPRTGALPAPAGVVIFAAAIGFGWGRRDFGIFLLGFFGFPVLLLAAFACFVIAAATAEGRRSMIVGAILILAAPFAEYATVHSKDRIRFFFWEAGHFRELDQLRGRDRIIAGWDDWGMAGDVGFSYLIVDARDDSATPAAAEKWRKRMGLECPLVDAQRMTRRLYIVATYECAFAGVPLPG